MGRRERTSALRLLPRLAILPASLVMMAMPQPPVDATPQADVAYAVAEMAAEPPPTVQIVAEGSWEFDAPVVGIIPPRTYVKKDYGPPPPLTGPILLDAAQYIGIPYVHGGEDESGFDCSGLVKTLFSKFDIDLPRSSREQFKQGEKVDRDELEPGDLVFFSSGGSQPNHVGIYIGDNKFLHAARKAKRVNADAEECKHSLAHQQRREQDEKHGQRCQASCTAALSGCHPGCEQDDDRNNPDRIQNREQADKYFAVFSKFEHGDSVKRYACA